MIFGCYNYSDCLVLWGRFSCIGMNILYRTFIYLSNLAQNDVEKKKENVIPTSSFQILMKNLNYFLFFCHIYV